MLLLGCEIKCRGQQCVDTTAGIRFNGFYSRFAVRSYGWSLCSDAGGQVGLCGGGQVKAHQ